MSAPLVHMEDVNLHYAAVAFRQRSLKAWVTDCLRPGGRRPPVQDVHALKHIGLHIGGGERVALLGHNGAGKSTLLKTVAGLYPISSGRLQVQGTVRSLFDLSLGFEPDATGRENILYRGLLLGLSPAFMRRKQDEIVDFAELGAFIDYPLRTYSAGMQLRLAFAISTTVGGELLLLDEVIGAGDARFMQRARQRIEALVSQADILLLASHDMAAVRSLCTRALVLQHGSIRFDGPVEPAIAAYLQESQRP